MTSRVRGSGPPHRWRGAAILSLCVALGLAGAFAALHALGARECTVVLSGGVPSGIPIEAAAPLGALYTMAWLAAVALAPPLAVAGVALLLSDAVLSRWAARQHVDS